MQHTPRSGHQCNPGRLRRRRKAATPTHHGAKVNVNRAAGAAAGESRRRCASLAATAQLSTACCDMLRRPCGNETLRPCRESRARGAFSVHASASAPDPLDAPVSGRPVRIRIAGCQQDCSQGRGRPMPAGAFVQRSYRARRNLLLSHPVPRQPRRRHAAEEGFSTKGS
jgi:hypothetical protein